MDVTVSIPFHAYSFGSLKLGLDSTFWNSLERPFRRVLLAAPAHMLKTEPAGGGCRLKSKAGRDEVLQDLRRIAGSPGLGVKDVIRAKVESLFRPLAGGSLDRAGRELVEAAQASRISREILSQGRPEYEGILWGVVRVSLPGGSEAVFEGSVAEIYRRVYGLDPGFRRGLERALAECRAVGMD